MFHRERPEKEYRCEFRHCSLYSYSSVASLVPCIQNITWGRPSFRLLRGVSLLERFASYIPLCFRFLRCNQYNDGVPDNSRYALNAHKEQFRKAAEALQGSEGQEQIRKVRELTKFAEEGLLSKTRPAKPRAYIG